MRRPGRTGALQVGHDHDHAHAAAGLNRRRLLIAFVLTAGILVVEVVGAILTGSLALLVDAAHMLTDVLGLGLALTAGHLVRRPATGRYTWGFERAEIISAVTQAAILLGVGVFALIEGVRRLGEPAEIPGGALLFFGVVGLAANLASMLVLRGGQHDNLNMKAAFLEVLNDALGSVAVIASAVVLLTLGWPWVDTVAGLIIAALILPRSLRILRQAIRVLMEAAPEGIEAGELREHLEEVPRVLAVHDLHVSRLSSTTAVLTAHVVVEEAAFTDGGAIEILERLRTCASEHFEVCFDHATFQLEPPGEREAEGELHA